MRYSLVVTHVSRNQANWPIDKGAESFEIMPSTVQLSILTYSREQEPITQQDSAKARII